MRRVSALHGAGLWAPVYDASPNPLLALEMRVIAPRIAEMSIRTLLDAGCGTGRWMAWAEGQGIAAYGVDASSEMLRQTASKPGLRGRCAQGSLACLPITSDAVDLAICSFAVSYVPELSAAFAEMSRISRRVLVSDLHPAAEAAGWTRSFPAAGEVYELEHTRYRERDLDHAAQAAGLRQVWRLEAAFGEPESPFFTAAGKDMVFETAVLSTLWERD